MKIIEALDILIAEKMSENLMRKWTINEAAKAIGKHYRPTYLAVQRLLNEEIIAKNSNNLLEPTFKNTLLFETAERYRAMNLKNKDVYIIANRLISNIKESFFIAVLFGSSVNGKGKDIDLLLILPNSVNISEFKTKAIKALGSISSAVDLNCVNEVSCYEMLNTPNGLNVMNEIMKNHLVLIGSENFYKIIQRWKYG